MKILRSHVGQLIIAGLESSSLTPLERAWLKIIQPGGVILFRRNIENAVQTWKLLSSMSSVSNSALLRCVDLEGGLVDRLRDAVAPMPSLAAVGATRRPALYRRQGHLIGREARAFGFNVVLAPVLDLGLPESSSVMRTRTYFRNPGELAAYADGFLAGLDTAGVLGCGKHFPGLGAGSLDSHHATPVIDRPVEELWQRDIAPYRALKKRLPIVMVSHAVYPASGNNVPASISPYWITNILRKRIGYRGLVLSDDLEMGGILKHTSIEEAAIGAIAAGTDIIEICKDPALILRAFEALLTEAERSATFRSRVETASRRIARVKKALLAPSPSPATPGQIDRLRKDILAFRNRCPEPNPMREDEHIA